jgi:hypothetical protein
MEAQFNDLCRRMLRFEKPNDIVEEETKPEPEETVEEKPKISRSERRAQERQEKKKQRKEQTAVKNKNANKGVSLSEVKTQVRLSQFDDDDKSRIEKILFNK